MKGERMTASSSRDAVCMLYIFFALARDFATGDNRASRFSRLMHEATIDTPETLFVMPIQ